MIITRRIEIFICEDDKALRKEYYDELYRYGREVVRAANMASSALFVMDNETPYLDDEAREKFTFIGCKGGPVTRQAIAYTTLSNAYKGSLSSKTLASLAQYVWKTYDDDFKKDLCGKSAKAYRSKEPMSLDCLKNRMWKASLRSYKSNMPIPSQPDQFGNLRFAEYTNGEGETKTGCFFSLMCIPHKSETGKVSFRGIPFQMKFGRDRSNNQAVVQSVIDGKYKMCTSSIKIDGKKIYLLLCVDMPKKEYEPIEGKFLYCYLGSASPIFCTPAAIADLSSPAVKLLEIGAAEEFLYRRREIQAAVRRCQVNNRYSKGGKGRKKKCQAIDRWHDVENNYVDTKLHAYSRMLVDLAVKHKCAKICLMEQIERENETKEGGHELILRNWSYFGLIEKIKYKAKMYGIDVIKN